MTMEGNAAVLANITNAQAMYGLENRQEVKKVVDRYDDLYATGKSENKEVDERRKNYLWMVTNFYNLVTEFYEYGWGQSFHFAPRHSSETFEASIARQEYYLALRLQLKDGMKVADLGCGIGGPMRNIARFSKAHVTGVNTNEFQLKRANKLNEYYRLTHLTSTVKADFMHLPFESNSYDAAYQIEAFCHAPDKKGVYAEVFRILKPGGHFAGYQWCSTPKYDKNDPVQRQIIFGIEKGNGVPIVEDFETEIEAAKAAGFEVLAAYDKGEEGDILWWDSLAGHWNISGFKHTPLGRKITDWFVWGLEKAWIAPTGSSAVHHLLVQTADDLVAGGQRKIFTPMFFMLLRKPQK